MLKAKLVEVDKFRGILNALSTITEEIILKIDKENFMSSSVYFGGGFYFGFKLNPICFKEYSIDKDMTIILPSEGLKKTLRFLPGDVVNMEIDDAEIKFNFVDGTNSFEYSVKQLAKSDVEYFDEKNVKSLSLDVDMILDTEIIKKIVDTLKNLGQLSVIFKWDNNGVVVSSSDEHDLVRFSTWFKKENIKLSDISKSGSAEIPLHQMSSVLGLTSGEKLRVALYGNSQPLLLENVDKSKISYKCVIAPYEVRKK